MGQRHIQASNEPTVEQSDSHGRLKAVAHYNAGVLRGMRGRPDIAWESYTEALKHDPEFAVAFVNKGLCWLKQPDRIEQQKLDYSNALRFDPEQQDALNNRGASQFSEDKHAALADFNTVISANPQHAVVYFNRGCVKDQLGDMTGARQDYDEAIQMLRARGQDLVCAPLRGSLARFLNNRGLLRARGQDLDGAIADYSEAVQLNPGHVNAYYNRGLCREAKRDFEGAFTDFATTLKFKPDHTQAHNRKAALELRPHDEAPSAIAIDARVRVRPEVNTPSRGWGAEGVCHRSIGLVKKIEADDVSIDFPGLIDGVQLKLCEIEPFLPHRLGDDVQVFWQNQWRDCKVVGAFETDITEAGKHVAAGTVKVEYALPSEPAQSRRCRHAPTPSQTVSATVEAHEVRKLLRKRSD